MALKDCKYLSKIQFNMTNISPLHIGGDENELLITEDNKVQIPATSLAGAFRAYLNSIGYEQTEELFEGVNNEFKISKTFICDSYGVFTSKEDRPNIKINNKLGINENKFQREFISSGCNFTVNLEVHAADKVKYENYIKGIYLCILGLHRGEVILGAYKTSGAGTFTISSIKEDLYDFNVSTELFRYLKCNEKPIKLNVEELEKITNFKNKFIEISIEGSFNEPILIKGIENVNYEDTDSTPIVNNKGELIVPGSSIKGVVRAQGEKILKYLNKGFLIKATFGSADSNEKIQSRVYAYDAVIDNNGQSAIYNRIKIDRFTGGTIKGALLDERVVIGSTKILLKFKKHNNEKVNDAIIGLLLLITRDMYCGDITFGSGNSVGRGRLEVRNIALKGEKEDIVIRNFNEKEAMKKLQLYVETLNSLKEEDVNLCI